MFGEGRHAMRKIETSNPVRKHFSREVCLLAFCRDMPGVAPYQNERMAPGLYDMNSKQAKAREGVMTTARLAVVLCSTSLEPFSTAAVCLERLDAANNAIAHVDEVCVRIPASNYRVSWAGNMWLVDRCLS